MSNNRSEKLTLVYTEKDLEDYQNLEYNKALCEISAAGSIALAVSASTLASLGTSIPVLVLGYSIALALIIDALVRYMRVSIGIEKAREHIKNNQLAFVDISWDQNGDPESLLKRKIESNQTIYNRYNSMDQLNQGVFLKQIKDKPESELTEEDINQRFIPREILVGDQPEYGLSGLVAAINVVSSYVQNDACAEFKHYVKRTASSAWNSFCSFFSTPLSVLQTSECTAYRDNTKLKI